MNPISICQSIIVTIRTLLQSKEFLEAHRLPNRFVRSSAKLSMRLREGFHIAQRCTGDCIQTIHGNPKDGTSDIDVRVISVPLDGGVTEYLATNIFDKSLAKADFKELYFMRWPIEFSDPT